MFPFSYSNLVILSPLVIINSDLLCLLLDICGLPLAFVELSCLWFGHCAYKHAGTIQDSVTEKFGLRDIKRTFPNQFRWTLYKARVIYIRALQVQFLTKTRVASTNSC